MEEQPLNAEAEQNLKRAVSLLTTLVKADAAPPAYRHLLALCELELAVPSAIPEIAHPVELLQALIAQYPESGEYRFELANALSRFDVRRLDRRDLPVAAERLRSARVQTTWLADRNPYATDYLQLHIHTLNKLAFVFTQTSRDAVGPREHQNAAGEAATCYEEAARRQAGLVQRFPKVAMHQVWLLKFRVSQADAYAAQAKFADAKSVLTSAVQVIEQAGLQHEPQSPIRPALHEAYRKLSHFLRENGDTDQAKEVDAKAERIRPGAQR